MKKGIEDKRGMEGEGGKEEGWRTGELTMVVKSKRLCGVGVLVCVWSVL